MTNYDILLSRARLVKSNQCCGGLLQGPRKGSKFLHSILSFSGSVQLYGLLCMLRAAESAFGTALFAKARKQKRDTSLDHRCVRFLFYPSFPANPQQFLASIAVAPPVLLGYTVISVPAAARAAGHVPEGGVSGRQRGILLRSICFNLRGSSRFVFWARSCTPFCRCPSRPASMA